MHHLSWSKGVAKEHSINLELDLLVDHIMRYSRDFQWLLQFSENEVRHDIFRLVLRKIIPDIFEATGIDFQLPEGRMHTHSKSSMHCEATVGIPTRQDTLLYIRDKMQLALSIKTSRPVNAIQAMYANRGGIATDITNELMRALKTAVLKKNIDEETLTSYHLSNDQLLSLEHETRRSSLEN